MDSNGQQLTIYVERNWYLKKGWDDTINPAKDAADF